MRSRLQPVGDAPIDGGFKIAEPPEAVPDTGAPPRRMSLAERQVYDILVRGVSQTALTIVSTLFTLLFAGSAFALWWAALPQPSASQLIGLGMYAAFVLALEYVRRR